MICGIKHLSLNYTVAVLCFVVGLGAVSIFSFKQVPSKADISPVNIPEVVTYDSLCTKGQTSLPKSQIRRIDFLNFAYPNKSLGYGTIQSAIELTGGEFEISNLKENFLWLVSASPDNITYADLTNDGEEEAIIEMFSDSGASGGEHFLYVYTMARGQAKFLWFFETHGSGTDIGGIKEIYSRDGDLILEIYGKNKVSGKGSTVAEDYECDGCYKEFTRARFHWNGKSFKQKGKAEILPLADKQN
ncbi:MAG: hypothetical protein H0U54_05400 [Acidobacteria bacterium]|nr:hypothetical protein [Acidobacteriota bacterium]